jgi:hypothetical protein
MIVLSFLNFALLKMMGEIWRASPVVGDHPEWFGSSGWSWLLQ